MAAPGNAAFADQIGNMVGLSVRRALGDAAATADAVAGTGDQMFASATARALPVAPEAAAAGAGAPAWFGPAVNAAVAAAVGPAVNAAVAAAVGPAVNAALAAATAPGGALHMLVSVSAHNSVARAQNALRAATGAAMIPLQDSAGNTPPAFPATDAALQILPAAVLGQLLQFYGQPVPCGPNQATTCNLRRTAFKQFIGLPA
jgi:hypothetical protein